MKSIKLQATSRRQAMPRWKEKGVALPSVYEQLKELIGPNTFIHFSTINKLGINPQSSFSTPLGVYAYPLVESIYNDLVEGRQQFAQDRPYMIVFRYNGNKEILRTSAEPSEEWYQSKINTSVSHANKLLEQVKTLIVSWPAEAQLAATALLNGVDKSNTVWINMYDEAVDTLYESGVSLAEERKFFRLIDNAHSQPHNLQQAEKDAKLQTPIGKLWNVTRLFSKDAREWAHTLRKLGIDGVVDDAGTCIIHINEPLQAVFFDGSKLDIIKVFDNPKRERESKNKKFYTEEQLVRLPFETKVKAYTHETTSNGVESLFGTDISITPEQVFNIIKNFSNDFIRLQHLLDSFSNTVLFRACDAAVTYEDIHALRYSVIRRINNGQYKEDKVVGPNRKYANVTKEQLIALKVNLTKREDEIIQNKLNQQKLNKLGQILKTSQTKPTVGTVYTLSEPVALRVKGQHAQKSFAAGATFVFKGSDGIMMDLQPTGTTELVQTTPRLLGSIFSAKLNPGQPTQSKSISLRPVPSNLRGLKANQK